MAKAADNKETKKQEYKEKKAKFERKISEWSEDEIAEHYKKVQRYYSKGSQAASLTGDFSFDGQNVYYWHTYDNNPTKLEKRRQLGWGLANREDARKAGLEDRRTQDAKILGDSCVEMSHGNCNAVLLKIPKELYELNQKVKEMARRNETLLDHEGKPVKLKTSLENDRTIVRKEELKIIEYNEQIK